VTAEGVETEQQLTALRALGCARVQGFEVAEPVSAEGLIAVLSSGDNSQIVGPNGADNNAA
jgi:EAL domain-containing protein (putative c-di-GMP-specific phosphodiesterase class I)